MDRSGFPHSSVGKGSAYKAGDPSSIAGLGRSPGEGKGYPLQYSGLENSMNCIVCGIAKSQTLLSNFHFTSVGRSGAVTQWQLSSEAHGRALSHAALSAAGVRLFRESRMRLGKNGCQTDQP